MKNTLVLLGIAFLTGLGISAWAVPQDKTQAQPKKSRHIKMIKMENGKKMELDTVLSGDDVFVWNGDTINPEKHIKKFSPSQFDKTHNPDGNLKGHKNVKIYRHKGNQPGGAMSWQMDTDDDIELFTDVEGDSIHKKIIIHRKSKDGDEKDHLMYFNHIDGENFPPMPPMPPMPHMKIMRLNQSKGMINLNDPKVISFKKKDMSGGREKIEIIRHKSDESDNQLIDIDMPDPVMAPGAPHPQSFRYEFNDGQQIGKKMRKEIRVEVKDDGKSQEKVTTEETK